MAKVELKGISSIDIVVEDKEFAALVGPGNTYIINMIAGLFKPTKGQLYINGELMNDVPPGDRQVAIVGGDYNQYPLKTTVFEFMASDLQKKIYDPSEISRRIFEAALVLDFVEILRSNCELMVLSGEQRQRVAIGRAFVNYPKLYLFDEPFSFLDDKSRIQMCALLSGLHKRTNGTIIYSTNDQAEAESMAGKIVMIKDGKVQEIIKVSRGDGQKKQTEERAKTAQNTKGSNVSRIPFEAYRGKEPYIFVSYAHADSNRVFPILSEFHNTGFPVWYDEGIDPGNEWPEEIANALDKCSLFVVFISASSAASVNVRNEINFALSEKKPFIAVWLEDAVLTPGLKLQIGSKQAIMRFRMNPEDFNRKCLQSFGASGIKKTAT
ncbi:MAG: TIR domain-containing protein [Treponema sp.]|jgi:ABC-type multidrug transport system ATPase subunit|nr:TIR domain-containing protein [Treponema sp.]